MLMSTESGRSECDDRADTPWRGHTEWDRQHPGNIMGDVSMGCVTARQFVEPRKCHHDLVRVVSQI